jgi:hypothetical protein
VFTFGLIILFVLLLSCCVGMSYVWRRHLTHQAALRWWWERQVIQAYNNAENLRDRVLQEAFALRRNLELSHEAIATDAALAAWQSHLPRLLTSANRLHQEVQQFSDQLSSPFLSDSLPLAIRHVVSTWENAYPAVQFSLDLPQDWPHQNAVQQDILTKVLDEWLHLCFTDVASPKALSSVLPAAQTDLAEQNCELAIALHTHQTWHILDMQLDLPAPLGEGMSHRRQNFHYLGQVFQTLMPGRYTLKLTPHRLCFRGCWHSL